MNQRNRGASETLRRHLAAELQALLAVSAGGESAAMQALEGRLGTDYASLMDSDARLHEICHYLADADIRRKDPEYRSDQERRINEVVAYLQATYSVPSVHQANAGDEPAP